MKNLIKDLLKSISFSLILIILITNSSCQKKPVVNSQVSTTSIEGNWKLVSIVDSTSNTTIPAGFISHITFQNDSLKGKTGAVQYFGSYILSSNNNLTINQLGTTLNLDIYENLEIKYLTLLKSVNSYAISADSLILYSSNRVHYISFVKY